MFQFFHALASLRKNDEIKERSFPDAVRQIVYPIEQIELHQPDEKWGGNRGCYAYNLNVDLKPAVSWRQCLIDCALKGFHLAGFQGASCACITQALRFDMDEMAPEVCNQTCPYDDRLVVFIFFS